MGKKDDDQEKQDQKIKDRTGPWPLSWRDQANKDWQDAKRADRESRERQDRR